MEPEKTPVTIKKYANRRLYNTGTSAYVTLEDLAAMVKKGDDFVVYDAKTGEDITRSVLTQIIFEQESKGGQGLLPITFLRQLIRFYGDSMQMMVPSYLEFSLDKLTKEKGGLADQYSMFAANPLASAARPFVGQIEEQTRQNMAMFRQALSMFAPFSGAAGHAAGARAPSDAPPSTSPEPPPGETGKVSEFDEMRRQIEALQRRMDDMSSK